MYVLVTVLNFAGAIDIEKLMTYYMYSPKCLNSASVVILSANERGHQKTLYICINRNYSVISITTLSYGKGVRNPNAVCKYMAD